MPVSLFLVGSYIPCRFFSRRSHAFVLVFVFAGSSVISRSPCRGPVAWSFFAFAAYRSSVSSGGPSGRGVSFRFLRCLVFVRLLGGAPFFPAHLLVSSCFVRGVRFSRGGFRPPSRLSARSSSRGAFRVSCRLVGRLVSFVSYGVSFAPVVLRLVWRRLPIALVSSGGPVSRPVVGVGSVGIVQVMALPLVFYIPCRFYQPRFPGVAWGVACFGPYVVGYRGGGYPRSTAPRSRSPCLVPFPRRIVIGSFRPSGPFCHSVGACRFSHRLVRASRRAGRVILLFLFARVVLVSSLFPGRFLIAIAGWRHTREASAFHMGQLGERRWDTQGGVERGKDAKAGGRGEANVVSRTKAIAGGNREQDTQ